MNPQRLPTGKGAIIELDEEDLRGEVIIHKNLTQDLLVTTEDKMKLALIEYRDMLAARGEWIGAGALVFSFTSPLLLANFRDIGPLTAETLQAFYIMLAMLASYRFIVILIKVTKNRHRTKVGYLISKLKQTPSNKDRVA